MERYRKYVEDHPLPIVGGVFLIAAIVGVVILVSAGSGGGGSTSEGKGYKSIEELTLAEPTDEIEVELQLEEALRQKYDHDYGEGARSRCIEHKAENEYACEVIAPYFGHNYYLYFITVDPGTGKARIKQLKNPYLSYSPYETGEYAEYGE